MPNDAKLGLVVGVGVVIAIAVVSFRTEGGPALPVVSEATAAALNARKAPTPAPVQAVNPATKTSQTNRAQRKSPDHLSPGTDLLLPDLSPQGGRPVEADNP